MFSYSAHPWALGNIFFNNGNARKSICEYLKHIYVPAGEESNFVEIISQLKQVDPKTLREGLYKCSCDFPYLIGNCTRPWVKHKCPNCGLEIGGVKHVLIKREGH